MNCSLLPSMPFKFMLFLNCSIANQEQTLYFLGIVVILNCWNLNWTTKPNKKSFNFFSMLKSGHHHERAKSFGDGSQLTHHLVFTCSRPVFHWLVRSEIKNTQLPIQWALTYLFKNHFSSHFSIWMSSLKSTRTEFIGNHNPSLWN